jgi:hypothetical protein
MSRKIAYDDDEIRRLWASGISVGDIAARFSASNSAISGRVKFLGLKPRPFGAHKQSGIEDCQAFRDAWASTLSYAEIGDALGCSADTVKRAGIRFCYSKRNLRRAAVPKPITELPPRAGVRQAGVMVAQSGINKATLEHVSLSKEPWLAEAPPEKSAGAEWKARVAKLAATGLGPRAIAKKIICHEIDVLHELARIRVDQGVRDEY